MLFARGKFPDFKVASPHMFQVCQRVHQQLLNVLLQVIAKS